MKRRTFLTAAASLAAPQVSRAQNLRVIRFMPHADLPSLDPIFSTADVTRNYTLAVHDTLYALDAEYGVHPQMAAGHVVENDGKTWTITLRDDLRFHDGTPVLARDCVATIKRFGLRYPMGQALLARTDEITAPTDKTIRIQLKKPFAMVPDALAECYCAIMPERLASYEMTQQITESIGSGPFKFVASERVPGQRAVFERNKDYVPRSGGTPSFNSGPKIVNVDRVEWNFIQDPSTAAAALMQGEIDWWENPTIDLIPQLKGNRNIAVEVKDRLGQIGCLRFNQLNPPFNDARVRRIVLEAMDQREIMTAVAGAEPSIIQVDVGIFVPGSPMASTVGVEITRGPKDYAKLKQALAATDYKGERIVVLAATTIPAYYVAAQMYCDALTKIGFNVDMQSLEWGSVMQRRGNREPIDKGGWNIFNNFLGGLGNISPAPNLLIRGNGANSWFGWPTNPKMEALRDAWFDAPDIAARRKLCEEMQVEFFRDPSYVPLGMFTQPAAYRNNLRDIPAGFPQFYGVKRV